MPSTHVGTPVPQARWHQSSTSRHLPSEHGDPLVRVVVIGDQSMVRTGLSRLVGDQNGLTVVAEGPVAQAVVLSSEFRPDVLMLLDDEPEPETLESLRSVTRVSPGTAVLLLTSSVEGISRSRLQEVGVRAVLGLEQPAGALLDSIRKVHSDDDVVGIDGRLDRGYDRDAARAPGADDPEALASLTRREREVLVLIGEGLRNADIAARLAISPLTVRNHVTSILDKLELADRFDLAVYAFRHGLVRFRQKRIAAF